MSAHWYWDWDWGRGGPSTQPALRREPGEPNSIPPTTAPPIDKTAEAERNRRRPGATPQAAALIPAATAGQGSDSPTVPSHNTGDPAPFPHPLIKPCQKVQVYFGQTKPGQTDQSPHYPPGVAWDVLEQREEYVDANGVYQPVDPNAVWYYWIACERANDCCKGARGCELYKFRTKLPNQKLGKDIYIWDFKCKCHNPGNP